MIHTHEIAAFTDSGILFQTQVLRAAKQFYYGTHRVVSPEITIAKIQPHLSIAGITRLADITGLDRIGIPTVLAHRPNSPTLSNAAGKGYTTVAAMVSAAMEGIEIYHAENLRLEVLNFPYKELVESHIALPINRLPLTKRSLFHPAHPEFWVLGWDIINQCETAVPYSCVSMTPKEQKPTRWMPFSMGSNGLASGNHLLEAIMAGLYEVVERDAVACHRVAVNQGVHQFQRVNLQTVETPLVLDLLERLQRASIVPLLYDCTVDTEIPCYMAIIYDERIPTFGLYRGYGAHLDPQIAMVRALTEAVQARLVYIAGSRDDFFRRDLAMHRLARSDEGIAALEAVPAVVDARVRCSEATDTFEGDVAIVLNKLQRVGLHQAIVCDLSHAEVGIPVVRVMVPGLEGYLFEHYTPGSRALAFIESCLRAKH